MILKARIMDRRAALEILEIQKESCPTEEELKDAYHRRMKQCHPDRHFRADDATRNQVEEEAKRVNEAREVLEEWVASSAYEPDCESEKNANQNDVATASYDAEPPHRDDDTYCDSRCERATRAEWRAQSEATPKSASGTTKPRQGADQESTRKRKTSAKSLIESVLLWSFMGIGLIVGLPLAIQFYALFFGFEFLFSWMGFLSEIGGLALAIGLPLVLSLIIGSAVTAYLQLRDADRLQAKKAAKAAKKSNKD